MLKRLLMVLFLCLFPAAATAEQTELTYAFPAPALHSLPGGETAVSLAGFPELRRSGEPVLPYVPVKVLLPQGHRLRGVEVIPSVWEAMPVTGRIVHGGAGFSSIHPMQAVGSPQGQGDQNIYEKVGLGRLAGADVLLLRLRPVAYDEVKQSLRFTRSLLVRITTEPLVESARLPFRGLPSDTARLRTFVDNPDALAAYRAQPPKDEAWEYLIVTVPAMVEAFSEFAAYKTDTFGLQTHIVTVDEATASQPGEDPAAQLRYFLRDAYSEHGTQWLLLGGDADGWNPARHLVPMRCVHCRAETTIDDECIPADLYFGNLDGPWDDNGDGLYGDADDGEDGGEVDLLAELYVGRIAADDATEARRQFAKIEAYDAATAPRAAILTGELLWPLPPQVWGGDLKDLAFAEMAGFTALTLYARDETFSAEALIEAINSDSYQIINSSEHGNWFNAFGLLSTQVGQLTNAYPFFGYSNGCYCGSFDNKQPFDDYLEQDCIVEDLTTGQASGAFAAVVNSREGFANWSETGGASSEFDITFMAALFGGTDRLGPALVTARESKIGELDGNENANRWVFMDLNILGDPHQRLKVTDEPGDDDDNDDNNDNDTPVDDDDDDAADDDDNNNDEADSSDDDDDNDTGCGCRI